ncbi:MAG: helicase RepA family protein [Reyranella sp.]|nr:helicase RepA family protein [Reyranella sp.]
MRLPIPWESPFDSYFKLDALGKEPQVAAHEPLELEFEAAYDIAEEEPEEWLVDNMIPETGLGLIWGESGTYKTFVALDMMAALHNAHDTAVRVTAWGLDLTLESTWFGRKIKQCECFYIPLEGHGGITKRIKAWQDANRTLAPFHVRRKPVDLRNSAVHRDALVKRMNRVPGRKLLLIDTLAQMGGDYDENGIGMAELVGILRDLHFRIPNSIVMAIHHAGKDSSKRERGWSGLRAALECSLQCKIEKDGPSLFVSKNRDGESNVGIPFATIRVDLEYDSGKKESSLVVVPREAQPAATGTTIEPPLGPGKSFGLRSSEWTYFVAEQGL